MSAPSSFPAFTSFPDFDASDHSPRKLEHSEHRHSGEQRGASFSRKTKRGEGSRQGRESKKKKLDHSSRAYDLVDFDERRARLPDEASSSRVRDETLSTIHDEKPLFYSDRKGDPLNVTFGGLHVYDVPKHFLIDRRKVLGLPVAFVVVDRGRHQISLAVGRGGKRKGPGLTDPSSRHLLYAPPKCRLLEASKDKYKYDEVDGFLRITSRRSHRASDQSYRAITAPAPNAESDTSEASSGLAEESSDSDSDTSPETSLTATLRSLEQQLAVHPSDVSTWLSLLSHTLSTVPNTTKNYLKTRADISLSVLSRALAAHPDNTKSARLRSKYINAGEHHWSETQLRLEWNKALEGGDPDLWMEWMDWRVRSNRGMEELTETVSRILAIFRSQDSEAAELNQLRVLWRAATAFREAGFVERAMAIFQAQAELLFSLPENMADLDFDDVLDALELFWESEVPRMGEPRATGWSGWEASGQPSAEVTSSSKTIPDRQSGTDPFARWATDELLADRCHRFSSRSFDSQDDSDPYSTILFSDIHPFLLELRSPVARRAFRLVWLSFLGLHIPGFATTLSPGILHSKDDKWASQHLSSPAYLNAIFPTAETLVTRISADSSAGALIGREKEYLSPFGPVKNWTYGAVRPLEWAPGSMQWGLWTQEDVKAVDIQVARAVFQQCRVSLEDDADWDLLHVAFEAAVDIKGALKLSKSLLASFSGSIPRWAAHARLERLRGKPDAARKVYRAVLSSAQSGLPVHSALWWDWAEMEWLCGDSGTAQDVIHQCAGTRGSGGIATLRAKRFFDDVIRQSPNTRWIERQWWVKLRILLELLTSTPESALASLDSRLEALRVGSVEHERLSMTSLALIYTHANILKHPAPQALLRDRTHKAIEHYPNNTMILGLFLEGERGQGVWGYVREMLGRDKGSTFRAEKDIARRAVEVWVAGWEKSKWEAEQERTRGLLADAVEDERTRGSAVLWRIYLEFEIRCGQLQRAKKLLFRAVGACAHVKELYLLAFGALRPVFTGRELQDWAEAMVERGLRLRRGLDEVLEGWVDEGANVVRSGGKESESEPEDEIEYNARELRRLRPYAAS